MQTIPFNLDCVRTMLNHPCHIILTVTGRAKAEAVSKTGQFK